MLDGSSAHGPSGLTVGDMASLYEFGNSHQPARSWLRSWVDQKGEQIDEMHRKHAANMTKSPRQVAAIMAAFCTRSIRQHVLDLRPALSPSTVKRKGHDSTFVESGNLFTELRSKVLI
jgi:hypothetical protein